MPKRGRPSSRGDASVPVAQRASRRLLKGDAQPRAGRPHAADVYPVRRRREATVKPVIQAGRRSPNGVPKLHARGLATRAASTRLLTPALRSI